MSRCNRKLFGPADPSDIFPFAFPAKKKKLEKFNLSEFKINRELSTLERRCEGHQSILQPPQILARTPRPNGPSNMIPPLKINTEPKIIKLKRRII